MKIGVTGGFGFIGSWVVEELILRGYEPVVYDIKGRLVESVETFVGDMRDEVSLTEFAARVDGIIHLAGVLGTQETITNPRPAVLSNIHGGMNFLEAITQYEIPGVYIGVGNHWMQNAYSISKTTVERLSHMYRNERGTRINQVRCVNAYGPRQVASAPFGPSKVRKVMPALICRALTSKPIEIYGNGEQISDCVYVKNVAEALVTALKCAIDGVVFDNIIEVGPENHTTVNEIAEAVARLSSEVTGLPPVDIIHLPMRPGEIPNARVVADVSTLNLIGLDVDDFIDLNDGISRTVEWFNQNKGVTWFA